MRISKNDYLKALQTKGVLNERRILVLKAIYTCPQHKATPAIIEYKTTKNIHFVNLIFGSLAKAIAKSLGIERNTKYFDSPEWWPLIAEGLSEPDGFYWQLRKNFVAALQELNIINEEHDFPDEANMSMLSKVEGGLKKVMVNSYERNRQAREECIKANGIVCKVCNINFEEIYGPVGNGFIHVHHVVKISEKGGKKYKINPVTDLQPVCPNCHAMLHRGEKELSIEELRKMVRHKF